MSDWKFLEEHRVTQERPCDAPEQYWSTPEFGCNGMFVFWIENVRVRCMASDGMGWRHISVSIIGDSRPPKWDVMCAVKDLFFEPEECAIQYHPPQSTYKNVHPGCLHIWMKIGEPFAMPPVNMV